MAKSSAYRLAFLEEHLDRLWTTVTVPEGDVVYLTVLLLETIRLELRLFREWREFSGRRLTLDEPEEEDLEEEE